MNTTKVGTEFENKVYGYFNSLLSTDKLGVSPKTSSIYKHKKYRCSQYSRDIIFDISIETYNPSSDCENWSSLIVIECKKYNRNVDIADFDEFRQKLTDISDFAIKGIMVTTKGFSEKTIDCAKTSHIGLVVFSPDDDAKWIVSRDINTECENLMPIMLGHSKAGITPIVYLDGIFTDVLTLCNEFGASISSANVIYLSNEEISKKASEIYMQYQNQTNRNDIAGEILSKLYPNFKITYCEFPKGVLANLSLTDKLISISNEIKNDIHRHNFTLAHEIGHLCLHKKILEKYISSFTNYEEQVLANIPDKIVKRLEIQANTFASYLLIPNKPFLHEVSMLFKKLRITKGRLYLDHQLCNQNDVNYCLSHLSKVFNVSKEAIKIRLLNSKLLIIDKNEQLPRIRVFLDDIK